MVAVMTVVFLGISVYMLMLRGFNLWISSAYSGAASAWREFDRDEGARLYAEGERREQIRDCVDVFGVISLLSRLADRKESRS